MKTGGNAGWPRPLGPAAALFASYFLLAVLGLRWGTVRGVASPMFPAAGVALAGLLLGGQRLWPAVFAGTMAAFFLEAPSLPLWGKAALASGNTLAALGGAWALRRARLRPALTRLNDVLLVSAAALGSSAVSATARTFALAGAFDQGFRQALVTWLNGWAGDVTGVIVVAPLVLSWARGEPVGRDWGRWLHLALSTAAAWALAWLSFGPETSRMVRPWLAFAALTWAALTWGVRGATAAMLPVAAVATQATTAGHGPFGTPAALQFELLQQFIGATAVTTLVLAVVADERRNSEALHKNEERLRRACRAGRIGLLEFNIDSGAAAWTPEAWALFVGGRPGRGPVDYARWVACIHPEDRAAVVRTADQAIKQARSRLSEAHYQDEYRVLHADGTVLWLASTGAFERAGDELVMLGVVRDITERKRAEEALRESEAQLRLALKGARAGVWDVALEPRTIYWSDEFRVLYGIAEGEAPNDERWQRCVHPDDLPRMLETIRGALESRTEGWQEEFRVLHPRRGERWILDLARIRRDAAGRAIGVGGIDVDVTDRKRAEAALRENEARLRLALRAGQTGVWDWDLVTGRVVWSDEVCGIFGIQPGTFEGTLEAFERRIYPDDRARVRAEAEAAVNGRAGYAIEFRIVRPDGQIRWVTDLGTIKRDEAGQPHSMIGMVTDITEKRAAADAIRESEERFRNIADNSPVMIWVTRPDTCCTYLNKVWSDFTGQAQAAGLGFGWLDMLHPEDVERSASSFRAASARREPFRLDYRLRRRDGQYRWCIDAAAPRFSPSGEFLGYVGSVIDITDRKQAEEERARLLEVEQAARSEAERANRMKDEFLSTVSHELRTPLTAILGWSHLLRRRVSREDEDLCKGLAVIDRNARAQAQLIEDLLDMGRITSGKIRLDVQPLDLHDVVGAAISSVAPSAEAKGIRLVKISSPAVGVTRGDPSRLQQVAWNLLSNAIKFTPEGGSVQVEVSRAGDHVEITVSDTGEGIAPEFLPYVFERFRQADASTTRRHGGLGLGLAIVKHLVELHGGTVRATSAGVGKGTTFTVELPLGVAHAPADDAADGRELNTRASGDNLCELSDLSGISVLFVDDAPDTRDMVRTFVEERKARVRLAGSGEEALRLLELERPDVLVSDIGMRGMDGYELIRRVRALPQERGGDVPAVALTAYAGNEDRTKALLAGFQTHLAKPIQPTELMAVIGVLAARGARKGRPQAGNGGPPLA
ncbi:PAS domain-containing protein [Sorangium sp. So ce131]|uniref:PAS domain-containing protein n=1 Tax=Sorangium sp. So ce131 TaxID=3133282 RepID=UPI003F5D6B43